MVLVTWKDAIGPMDEWGPLSEVDLVLPVIHTVGWLVAETSEAFCLVTDIDYRDDELNVHSAGLIPKGMVVCFYNKKKII